MKTLLHYGCCLILTLSSLWAKEPTKSPTPIPETLEAYNQRMDWFVNAQYGMFIHFGLYSIPGGIWNGEPTKKYSEWIQGHLEIPKEEYSQLTEQFNPQGFDANKIVSAAKNAGMTYLVITAKHHEGFCLWDSAYTEYDLANTPIKDRDLLMELKEACTEHGLEFGLYYSILDWHHPSQTANPKSPHWGRNMMVPGKEQAYFNYQTNQVLELIKKYSPTILWFDGDWAPWWNMKEGIKLHNAIRSADPNIITNNRIAKRDFYDLDFVTQEQTHFDEVYPLHWEGCYTMNNSWGYKKGDNKWKSAEDVYQKLKDINEKGGNLLLNVGPDGNGEIQDEAYQILAETAKLLEKTPIKKATPAIHSVPGVRKEKRVRKKVKIDG